MKKAIILILVIVAIFALYFYKRAYSRATLAIPETDTGEVSAYNVPKVVQGSPAPKGTENLNLTGPVYDINQPPEQK
ncbi:MAG: hypothetical protein NT014_07970 [Candidatus Omnitrophica bacterium]|nr:hypothetical protein [Candidatus Omnitrophota bacterium]